MLYLLKPTALSALMVPHCSESELYTQPIDTYPNLSALDVGKYSTVKVD